MLDGTLRSTKAGGAVTCCGMIASTDLSTSIYPFILRGVRLIGIDSAECPMDERREVWNRLAGQWSVLQLDQLVTECRLEDLPDRMDAMLSGHSRGRVCVNLEGDGTAENAGP